MDLLPDSLSAMDLYGSSMKVSSSTEMVHNFVHRKKSMPFEFPDCCWYVRCTAVAFSYGGTYFCRVPVVCFKPSHVPVSEVLAVAHD